MELPVPNVGVDKLRYLDKLFMCLPVQGIRAKLHGIRTTSPNGVWTVEAGKRFLSLVQPSCTAQAGLWAIVQENLGNETNKCLSVILMDTYTNDYAEGIRINNVLVDEGHADWSSKTKRHHYEYHSANTTANNDFVLSSHPTSQQLLTPSTSAMEFFKLNKVGNHQIHVIKIKGGNYLMSKEISKMFPKWKNKDILGKMITVKKRKYPYVDVNLGENQDFSEEYLV